MEDSERTLLQAFLGGGKTPLHKPKHIQLIGEDSSILGT